MNIGIIGAGFIVKNFLSFANEIKGLHLEGICATLQEEKIMNELCEKHKIKTSYTNYDKMLMNEAIDVIYIGVPNHLHFAFARKALDANKHVICEKPFTSNYKEANTLIKMAKEKNLIILDAITTRYLPNTKHIKNEIEKLGELKIVSMNYSQYSSRYNAFKQGEILPAFNPEMSGGALMDLNIYNINFALLMFGEPKHSHYEANIQRGIDTSGILTLDYGSFKCVCIAAKDCKAPLTTTIQGDAGCIVIESPVNAIDGYQILMNSDSSRQMKHSDEPFYNYNQDKHKMMHEFEAFVEVVQTKDFDHVDKMNALTLSTMKILDNARKSANIVFPSDC